MKNLLIKTALVAALLFAPMAQAQGKMNLLDSDFDGYDIATFGGILLATVGGLSWNEQSDEAKKCRDANASRSGNALVCLNQSELDDQVDTYVAVTAAGVVIAAGGMILGATNNFAPVQIRAKEDGSLALERDGLSLATRGDKFSMEKRWTF